MAANAITALNPENWKPVVQDYLNNMLVSRAICNTKCEAQLSDGDQVNFPYVADVRVQSYAQGTDLTADALAATQDSLTVDQSKAAVFVLDPVQEKQAKADYGMALARQCAYQLGNEMDQRVIASGVTNATDSVTGGTLTTSTLLSKMADARSELARNNATDGELFAVLDPERISLLTQTFVANGFQIGDRTLVNGFAGKALGFDVYESNNLAYAITLTCDTQPTATDTFTIAGVTWTCVADGTCASPGEINIGADLADFKTIFVKAINGESSADYVDVSTANRRKYQNMQVTAATFVGDGCALTSYGKMAPTETFTAGTNIFGTETSSSLFGRKGAISMAMQMYPELYIREEPLQLAKNYITHQLYGVATFVRDRERVVKMTFNV